MLLPSPPLMQVHYVLSRPPAEGWPHLTGRISLGMMQQYLYPAGPSTLGLVCGPPGLVDTVCKPGLEAMGYLEEHTVFF